MTSVKTSTSDLACSVLVTPRLRLRPMSAADLPTVVRWRNAPHVARSTALSTAGDLTLDRCGEWFAATRHERLDYIIELRDGCKPIGSVSMRWLAIAGFGQCGESGRYIGEAEALGHGYATEAAAAWLEHVFETCPVDCIVARTRSSNIANIRINDRLGLRTTAWPSQFGPADKEWQFMCLERSRWHDVSSQGVRS